MSVPNDYSHNLCLFLAIVVSQLPYIILISILVERRRTRPYR